MGMLLAVCFKQLECVELSLPTVAWKYLLTRSLDWQDVRAVSVNQVVCLEKILSMPDQDLDYLEETFTTFLADGQEYELMPGGKQRRLTVANRHEYVHRCRQVVLDSLRKPLEHLRRGFLDSAFSYVAADLAADELEKHSCGMDYVGWSDSGGHRRAEADYAVPGLRQPADRAPLHSVFLGRASRFQPRTARGVPAVRVGPVAAEPLVRRHTQADVREQAEHDPRGAHMLFRARSRRLQRRG